MKMKGKLLIIVMALLLVSGMAFIGCKAKLPPDILNLLSVTDDMQTLLAETDLPAFNAMSEAVIASEHEELNNQWNAVMATLPDFTLARAAMLDMTVWMLVEVTEYTDDFPASVQPLLGVADDMQTLLAEPGLPAFNAMSEAVIASDNEELNNQWNAVMATLPDFTLARAAMLDMTVWMLVEVTKVAPGMP